MKNCCEETLYAEFLKGIDIESYLELLENDERCCHHEIAVAVRNWWCSPDYDINRNFYKEIISIIKPLLDTKIVDTYGFEAFAYGGHYDAEVSLDFEYYINGAVCYEISGECQEIIIKLTEFVNNLDIEAVLKTPHWYEI